jgi:hypothetical protein
VAQLASDPRKRASALAAGLQVQAGSSGRWPAARSRRVIENCGAPTGERDDRRRYASPRSVWEGFYTCAARVQWRGGAPQRAGGRRRRLSCGARVVWTRGPGGLGGVGLALPRPAMAQLEVNSWLLGRPAVLRRCACCAVHQRVRTLLPRSLSIGCQPGRQATKPPVSLRTAVCSWEAGARPTSSAW